jgi:hypothetical protein
MDFDNTTPYDALCEKWDPLLEHEALPRIEDSYKKKVTSVLLENQEKALREQYLTEQPNNSMGGNFADAQVGSAGNLQGYDPVLISLVRRAMPNLMAYDIAGVQPMSAPTGLIFAMRARYTQQNSSAGVGDGGAGSEALYQEADPEFSGNSGYGGEGDAHYAFSATGGVNPTGITGGFSGTTLGPDPRTNRDGGHTGPLAEQMRGMLTGTAEGLGDSGNAAFQQMAFNIDRVAVEARSRALKAEYTTELAQDLKAVHGLDAETELANILSTEILSEINRELVRTIYYNAQLGAKQSDLAGSSTAGNAAAGGIYDLAADADGRWSAERFRGLMYQIEREANVIAKETRRGKGNFIIVSSDVASALAMGGFLNISPALNNQLDVDDTGNTFAGVLNGKMRVYIDPYSSTTGTEFCCVGYKGTSPYDAGLFYCPYVPLQMVRAVGQDTFQPKIGFKTRYGMVNNPFARHDGSGDVFNSAAGGNYYYRLFGITNLHGQNGN